LVAAKLRIPRANAIKATKQHDGECLGDTAVPGRKARPDESSKPAIAAIATGLSKLRTPFSSWKSCRRPICAPPADKIAKFWGGCCGSAPDWKHCELDRVEQDRNYEAGQRPVQAQRLGAGRSAAAAPSVAPLVKAA